MTLAPASPGEQRSLPTAQFALDQAPDEDDLIMLSKDVRHAFGSLERKDLFDVIDSSDVYAPLRRAFRCLYDGNAPIYTRDAHGFRVCRLRSQQGVRQGCQSGSVAFAIGKLGPVKAAA